MDHLALYIIKMVMLAYVQETLDLVEDDENLFWKAAKSTV